MAKAPKKNILGDKCTQGQKTLEQSHPTDKHNQGKTYLGKHFDGKRKRWINVQERKIHPGTKTRDPKVTEDNCA